MSSLTPSFLSLSLSLLLYHKNFITPQNVGFCWLLTIVFFLPLFPTTPKRSWCYVKIVHQVQDTRLVSRFLVHRALIVACLRVEENFSFLSILNRTKYITGIHRISRIYERCVKNEQQFISTLRRERIGFFFIFFKLAIHTYSITHFFRCKGNLIWKFIRNDCVTSWKIIYSMSTTEDRRQWSIFFRIVM